MNDDRETLDQQIALFRHSVIGELAHWPNGKPGIGELIKEKASQDYVIPGTLRTRVAPETLRGWLKLYRAGGFEALQPKRRRDKDAARSIPVAVADLLVSIKDGDRKLSVRQVIARARADKRCPREIELPLSTVHRLLGRHGLMVKEPEQHSSKDRRRFSYQRAGQLWMSDVMHGPTVRIQGKRKRKTYLIAFIDDATRVVPYAAFALAENTAAFMPVFKQAIMRRGIPERLYVDNGAAYRSQHLALVCARLGITLIHARPRDAAAKGKQERWFRTARMQLLTELGPQDLSSIEALNRRLWVYVEQEYHRAPHRGIDGQTPLDRWAATAEGVRYPDAEIEDLFLFAVKRKVHKDRTVSLKGIMYEVDATLVGQTVELRYDPTRLGADSIQVWHRGGLVHQAKPVDQYANCFVKRQRPSANPDPDTPPVEAPKGLDLAKLASTERSQEK